MILITGGTGFIGSPLVTSLIRSGERIRLLVRNTSKVNFKENSNLELIRVENIFSLDNLKLNKILQGIDKVIHIAWNMDYPNYLNSQKNIESAIGSLRLTDAIVNSQVKYYLGIGTCFEYKFSNSKITINDLEEPKSVYALSKAYLNHYNKIKFLNSKIKYAWCRPFYLYGEGENSSRLYPYVIDNLKQNKIVELSDGLQVRDYLHVTRAAEIIKELQDNNSEGIYNICSGNPITLRDFVMQIASSYKNHNLIKFGARQRTISDPDYVVGVPNY